MPKRRRRRRPAACPAGSLSIREIDATAMARGLYQGGLAAFEEGPCSIGIHDLDLAVVLAPDTGVKLWEPKATYYIDLDDAARDLRKLPYLAKMADYIVKQIDRGYRVGIFCREGRNRSGLLMALVLVRLKGWTGRRAMNHIQSRRAWALTNEYFQDFLKDYGGATL